MISLAEGVLLCREESKIKENKDAKCREHDWIMKVLVSAPRVVSTMSVSHKNVLEFL